MPLTRFTDHMPRPSRPYRSRLAFLSALGCLLALGGIAEAAAKEIISPKGLKVWLIEDHQTQVFTLGFRFAGGSVEDPPGKEGLAHMAAELFFQGGGDLAPDDYLARWSDLGAEVNVEARLESIRGTVRVLTPDREKAMELLKAAVAAPRFDAAAIDQTRHQIENEIDHDADDPEATAYLAYDRLSYGTHPRARPVAGTHQTIVTIAGADLATYRRHVTTRSGLSLAAVGDITPAELGLLVDRVFADLPPRGEVGRPPIPSPSKSARLDLPMSSDLAEVVFGVSLPDLGQRERLAAELINYTFGGSAFTSRLFHEVREKRGLAYSLGTNLDQYSFMAELSGSFGTAPGSVEEALDLVRVEFHRLADAPPTDDEIAEAKVALAGEYLRGLIRQADLANELTLRMSEGRGPDAIDRYAGELADIAPDEVRALARRIPWLNRLVIVDVGAPGSLGQVQNNRLRLQLAPAKEP